MVWMRTDAARIWMGEPGTEQECGWMDEPGTERDFFTTLKGNCHLAKLAPKMFKNEVTDSVSNYVNAFCKGHHIIRTLDKYRLKPVSLSLLLNSMNRCIKD